MEAPIAYLSAEEVIKFNILALEILRVKKKDRHQVLSRLKLDSALDECKSLDGNIYEKAAALMSALIVAHAFASGNRRTAFISTKQFVSRNKGKFSIPDDANYAPIMQGIREGRYPNNKISEWIKYGKIIERKR